MNRVLAFCQCQRRRQNNNDKSLTHDKIHPNAHTQRVAIVWRYSLVTYSMCNHFYLACSCIRHFKMLSFDCLRIEVLQPNRHRELQQLSRAKEWDRERKIVYVQFALIHNGLYVFISVHLTCFMSRLKHDQDDNLLFIQNQPNNNNKT